MKRRHVYLVARWTPNACTILLLVVACFALYWMLTIGAA